MQAKTLRALLATVLCTAVMGAAAESPHPLSCELPTSDTDPLADRAGLLARYERLPQACLREIFSACSEASRSGLLDFGTAAACSLGYEALLSQAFGGSFQALMAWWRERRGEATLQ